MRDDISSWNRIPAVAHCRVETVSDRSAPLPPLADGESAIAFGNGRSYGDVCLNPGQTVFLTRSLDRFIAFDRATGLLTCEAGVLLSEILQFVTPMGWFLAVTPGTRYVTVGGAIASDGHDCRERGMISPGSCRWSRNQSGCAAKDVALFENHEF